MDLYPLPEAAVEALRRRNVDERADRIIAFMLTCLLEGAVTTAQDLGPDRYDDAISEGVTRWRRGSNRMVREERRGHRDIEGLRVVEESNAVLVQDGDVVVCFYSARNGVDHPDLSGSGRRDRIVTEQQLQIDGMAAGTVVKRLVLLYRGDEEGLVEAAVAVMASARDPEWLIHVFQRTDGGPDGWRPSIRPDDPDGTQPPSYDEQPVPDLPPVRRRGRPDEKEATG